MQIPIDRTYEFQYDVSGKARKLPVACVILVAVAIWGAFSLPKPEFVFLLIAIAFMGILLALMGTVLLEAKKRLTHRIIVTPEGVVFDDGKQRIEARWEEVTELRTEPLFLLFKRYIVVTANGAFEFTPALKGVKALCALLAHNAVNAQRRGWKD